MNTAAAALDRLGRLGGTLELRGDRIKVRAPRPLPTELLAELRERKAAILSLLDGSRCRYCGEGPLDWHPPGAAVALGDGTSAHRRCRDRWLAERAADPRHATDAAKVWLRREVAG